MNRRRLLQLPILAGAAAAIAAPARASSGKTMPPDAAGMLYDSTLCIGCKTCVVACREANGLAPSATDGLHDQQTELNATTKNVIKLYRDREQPGVWAFMKQQCMHCIDPACVSACMIGALQKRVQGAVTYEKDTCVGCRYCQIACPFQVPKFEFSSVTPQVVKCELCAPRLQRGQQPACTEVCPRQAVIFGRRDALLQEAKARIARSPGKYQPKVYGEHDGGGTQVLYLSRAEDSFAKLGLPDLGDEAVPHLSESIQHGVYQGMLTPAVLYAGLGALIWRNRRNDDAAKKAAPHPEEER